MKNKKIEIILGIIIVCFITLFSFLAVQRYTNLDGHYYDLGIMNQVVYNTSQGWFLEMTNQDFGMNMSRFAIHFDPIMALFAPFYWLLPSPTVLVVGQALLVGLGAIGIYLLGMHLTKEKLASLFFAVVYLCYFPVQRGLLFDFHSVVLATPLLIFAVYFSLTKKYIPAAIFIALALLTKEHVGLVTGLLGLYLAFFKKEYRFGLCVATLSFIIFGLTFFYIIPTARQGEHFALKYISNEDGFTDLSVLVAQSRISYLKMLLLPQLPLIIFSPIPFLIAAPELGINLLSQNSNLRSFFFHYNSVIVVFVMWSMLSGYARMKKMIRKPMYQYAIMAAFIILFVQQIYLYGPLPVRFVRHPHEVWIVSQEKKDVIAHWQEVLSDPLISVASTPRIAPFFTNRRYFYDFLYDPTFGSMGHSDDDIISAVAKYEKADFVIINKAEIPTDNPEGLTERFYQHLISNTKYQRVADYQEIEVYKKIL